MRRQNLWRLLLLGSILTQFLGIYQATTFAAGLRNLPLDRWQRHVIDPDRPWRAIFVLTADLNGDTLPDVASGAWWYRNPGRGKLHEPWERIAFGEPLRNVAALYDFDGDGTTDVLGTTGRGSESSARFVWARNLGGGKFQIADNIARAEGDFLQGVVVSRFQPGGLLQVALSWHRAGQGVQMFTVPKDPLNEIWSWQKISDVSQDEDLSVGDIDGDGRPDLLLGTIWLKNEGHRWVPYRLSNRAGDPDRNRLVDVDGDGKLDAVVGYEAINKPGLLAWYRQPQDPRLLWEEHIISQEVVGPMSLDVGDLDEDGKWDIVVGEHWMARPQDARLLIFKNVNGGKDWRIHEVARGDEHHCGAILVDIDRDGDLDIISIGWSHPRVLLYENLSIP